MHRFRAQTPADRRKPDHHHPPASANTPTAPTRRLPPDGRLNKDSRLWKLLFNVVDPLERFRELEHLP